MIKVEFRGTPRPLYQEILKNPPKDINYRLYNPYHFQRIRKLAQKTGMPGRVARRIYWLIRYNQLIDRTLVHMSNYWDYAIIRMGRRFVADTENVGTFVSGWKFENLFLPNIQRMIEKSIRSKYCRKILPLTLAARKSMEAVLNLRGVEEKIEVMYPAIRELEVESIRGRNDEKVRILFVGSSFQIKGGRELLEAFKILKKKYDTELVIVSQEAYNNISSEEGLQIFPRIPREDLLTKFYPSVDIFCLPTYADSFGFVFLEAKSAGLPIVSTDHFHIPEIVEDGKSGLLIKAPISCWNEDFTHNLYWQDALRSNRFPQAVSELVDKLSILIEDTSLRNKMGKVGRREVEEGKFSIKMRNKKLKKIYEDALRR